MGETTGSVRQAEQLIGFMEFLLPMQITEQLLVVIILFLVLFLEQQMEERTGLVRQAEQLTGFWVYLLPMQITERLLGRVEQS